MTTNPLQPDVSFVIAAFNAEETVERAVSSALAQSGVTVEVIVVDDCSTDRTRETVSHIEDERVRLIARQQNGGPAAARNVGFAAARGRWIAVLDSDDAVYPARLVRMIEKAEAAGAQVVVDNMEVVPLEGGKSQVMFPGDKLARRSTMTLAEFVASNIIFQSTFNFGYMKPIFEREFLLRHRLQFDESLLVGEDYLLLASALACGATCAVVPDVGYIYNLRHGSISRVLEHHHLEAMLASDRAFLARFALDPAAMAAQRKRTRSIKEAAAFLTLVDEIKRGAIGAILKTAIGNPSALRHLRMPISVRMRRLLHRGPHQPKYDPPGRGLPPERNKEWT